MAYVTPTTVLTNDLIAAGDWNKNTVTNPIALRTGEIALASQAVGDLVIATSATQLGRVADVAVGQVLVSGGVATAPAYSASPSITAMTYTTNLKSTTALATPGALSATQATAFASTVSGAAIMGFGTTNDVSLMNRAGTVVLGVGPNTTTVNMTGLLSVSGFGTHSFSAGGTGFQELSLRNTTAGAGNGTALYLGNDASIYNFQAYSFSSTYTTNGRNVANGVTLEAQNAGGLSLAASNASGAIRFYSGGSTLRGSFDTSGNLGLVLPLKMQNNSAAMTTALAMSGNAYDVVILGGNTNYSGLYYNATVPAANAGLNGAVQVNTTGSIYFYSGGSRYVLVGTLA